jgi:hypothetical protein
MTDRILTTHAGSLARPRALLDFLVAMEHGEPVDAAAYEQTLVDAVGEVVRRQVDAGIDVIDDGEMGKPNWIAYLYERVSGIEPRFVPAEGGTILPPSRDRQAFRSSTPSTMPSLRGGLRTRCASSDRGGDARGARSSTRWQAVVLHRADRVRLHGSRGYRSLKARSPMSRWSTRSSRWWRLRASTG